MLGPGPLLHIALHGLVGYACMPHISSMPLRVWYSAMFVDRLPDKLGKNFDIPAGREWSIYLPARGRNTLTAFAEDSYPGAHLRGQLMPRLLNPRRSHLVPSLPHRCFSSGIGKRLMHKPNFPVSPSSLYHYPLLQWWRDFEAMVQCTRHETCLVLTQTCSYLFQAFITLPQPTPTRRVFDARPDRMQAACAGLPGRPLRLAGAARRGLLGFSWGAS